ncbi:thermonuclease family protein [Rhizobium sp.]|uniref:thermonuclease family protein n=1 Tax=Rhizobium sp. TaxID=391 RepID=UPI00289F4227
MIKQLAAVLLSATLAQSVHAADPISGTPRIGSPHTQSSAGYPTYKGPVSIIDGRTLWFGWVGRGIKLRLAEIDACELPQWALDPKWTDRSKQLAPSPVACGALAKAWLKRTIGNRLTTCRVVGYGADGIAQGRCLVKGRDIGEEMLRVGWARVTPPVSDSRYIAVQNHAMASRYGMWATYVLDMSEWRRKAVDKTLARHPNSDFNLLAERESEISPPFAEARSRPKRTDR